MGSSKDHFLGFRVLLPGIQKYFREYLCENENILGYCSRAQVLSIYAKNQSSKISCYSPFNLPQFPAFHVYSVHRGQSQQVVIRIRIHLSSLDPNPNKISDLCM